MFFFFYRGGPYFRLIDIECVDIYRLYQLHQVQLEGKPLSNLEFGLQLTNRLLEYSIPVKLQYLRFILWGKRLFGVEFEYITTGLSAQNGLYTSSVHIN